MQERLCSRLMITRRMMRRERETARTTTGKSREIIGRLFRREKRSTPPPPVLLVASGQCHMCLLAVAFYYGRNKEEGPLIEDTCDQKG